MRFNSEAPASAVRLVAENSTGYVMRAQASAGDDEPIFTSIGDETQGELDSMPVDAIPRGAPVRQEAADSEGHVLHGVRVRLPRAHRVQRAASVAQVRAAVQRAAAAPKAPFGTCRELILDVTGKALAIGMVTWLMTLYTLGFPDGHEIIINRQRHHVQGRLVRHP
jgi:hypothetical protein